jgi:hypothetical protein
MKVGLKVMSMCRGTNSVVAVAKPSEKKIRVIENREHYSELFKLCKSFNTRGLISLWLYEENNKLRDLKMYLLYIFPPELHTLMASLF